MQSKSQSLCLSEYNSNYNDDDDDDDNQIHAPDKIPQTNNKEREYFIGK